MKKPSAWSCPRWQQCVLETHTVREASVCPQAVRPGQWPLCLTSSDHSGSAHTLPQGCEGRARTSGVHSVLVIIGSVTGLVTAVTGTQNHLCTFLMPCPPGDSRVSYYGENLTGETDDTVRQFYQELSVPWRHHSLVPASRPSDMLTCKHVPLAPEAHGPEEVSFLPRPQFCLL